VLLAEPILRDRGTWEIGRLGDREVEEVREMGSLGAWEIVHIIIISSTP
jgi:hypothetical protein